MTDLFVRSFFHFFSPSRVADKIFMKEGPGQSQNEKPQIPEEVTQVIRAHVAYLIPGVAGRRELAKRMGDAAFGVAECSVGRAIPPLFIEEATLSRGKSKVFVGPNGSGKSTFFDAVTERDAYLETGSGSGAIVVGTPVHAREKLCVARLDQEELLGPIENFSAGEVLESAARFFKNQMPIDWEQGVREVNLKNQDAHVRIDTLMNQITALFSMEDFLERPVHALSGGERTKLALFTVLLSEPDVLLLDEPTNHLDLQSIAKLMAVFRKYKEAGVAVVSVSHVDWFLEEAGEDGVLEVVWNQDGRKLSESGSSFKNFRKNPARERIPLISGDIAWIQEGYGHKRGESVVDAPMECTVPDSPLRNIRFPAIHGGELVILSGNNGTGKTKLLETMATNTRQDRPRKQKGVQIAYLPQFWPEEVARGTVGEFFRWIKESASPFSTGSAYHREQPAQNYFIKLVNQLSFGGAAHAGESWLSRPLAKFSGGEQRLLWFVAVSALRDIDMLLLDEPTNHMDRFLQGKVAGAVRSFPGAVVLSTHDRTLFEFLDKDAGTSLGQKRIPRHLVLEKKSGVSTLVDSKETPSLYVARLIREAKKEAKNLKI